MSLSEKLYVTQTYTHIHSPQRTSRLGPSTMRSVVYANEFECVRAPSELKQIICIDAGALALAEHVARWLAHCR